MKKYFLLASLLVCTVIVSAQQAVFADGSPVKEIKAVDIIGSEMYNSNWQNATVLLTNGKSYKVEVKYNIYVDELFFLKKDVVMSFLVPVKEFKFDDFGKQTGTFRNGYPNNQNFTNKSYYQILVDGSTQLLKKFSKQVMETKEFNSSVVKKNFVDVNNFYLYKANKILAVKNDKSSVLTLSEDKKAEISKYISDNKINVKKEEGLVQVLTYYNSQ